jgi:stage V sporulation protein G
MEITRVKIRLCDDERIKAYATITIDDCFVIQGLDSPTAKKRAIFFLMPGRKSADGTYVDIVHPLNNETRQMIQEKVCRGVRESCWRACKETFVTSPTRTL